MRIVKQNRFKNLGELHKEWTEAGVKASRATTHRRVKEFDYSCRQRHLTWAKEKKNVSGYVCNHGSPSGERDTASPRGRYGERLSVTRV